MSVRLEDKAELLTPVTVTDDYSTTVADWSQDPQRTPIRFKGEPLASAETTLTADTVVSRWRGYLPPNLDGVVTPQHRIRWDGTDYEIDGEIERYKHRSCVRYLAVTLKRVRD